MAEVSEDYNLCFDDVQILDGMSRCDSRDEVDLSFKPYDPMHHRGKRMDLPIFAAAMDTVVTPELASVMIGEYGAGVVHHRGGTVEDRCANLEKTLLLNAKRYGETFPLSGYNGVAIGLDESPSDVKDLIDAGANLVAIEVAAANNVNVVEKVEDIMKVVQQHNVDLMVGNLSRLEPFIKEAGREVLETVDYFKVSQGGGSVCLTREKTGIGKPTFQATLDSYNLLHDYDRLMVDKHLLSSTYIVADGGLRKGADLVKSFGAGASAVMLGSMLSGHDENYQKEYRGMASSDAKEDSGLNGDKYVEGTSVENGSSKGSVADTLDNLICSLKSGISTAGFNALGWFSGKAEFVKVTNAGVRESMAHARFRRE